MTRGRARVLAAALAGACGGPPEELGGPPAVALGIGERAGDFTPLADGGPLPAYQGPQGGFHVFLAVRTTGLSGGDADEAPAVCGSVGEHTAPCVDLVVEDPADGRALDLYTPLHLPLIPAPDGRRELEAPRLVQLDIAALADVVGRPLAVRATVTDRAGRRAETALTAVAVDAAAASGDAGASR